MYTQRVLSAAFQYTVLTSGYQSGIETVQCTMTGNRSINVSKTKTQHKIQLMHVNANQMGALLESATGKNQCKVSS